MRSRDAVACSNDSRSRGETRSTSNSRCGLVAVPRTYNFLAQFCVAKNEGSLADRCGQKVTPTVEVQFVWALGANIGASHFSYWTAAEISTFWCIHQSNFTEPSLIVSPPGMKSPETVTCR